MSATNQELARRSKRRANHRLSGWVLMAPALLLIVLLRLVPMVIAAVLSFTDMNFTTASAAQFVGFYNYFEVVSSEDFQSALVVTLMIVLPALVAEMGIGLAVALWLNRPTRGRKAARAVMLVPYLLVPVVIGNFFRMFFSAQFGQLNYYLALLGFEPHAWLTDPATVRWAVVGMEVWHTTPFVALVTLAGLMGLSADVMEAAVVDGANAWQRFRYVLMPALLPILGAVLVLRAMDAIQLFDEVYVLTGGGPGRESSVINLYLYQFGFRQFRMGETSAAITLIVGAIATGALLVMVFQRFRNGKGSRR